MSRVVITGAGTVNALALDVAGTCAAFREGRCGITPLDIRDKDRLNQPSETGIKFNPPGLISLGTCDSSSDTETDGKYKSVTSKSLAADTALCHPFLSSIVPFGAKQYETINKRERRISERT